MLWWTQHSSGRGFSSKFVHGLEIRVHRKPGNPITITTVNPLTAIVMTPHMKEVEQLPRPNFLSQH